MTTPKLSARRLFKAFGPVTVLHNVDVDFFAGEIHAVVGENGAGKSTLMRILSGILEPTAGEVWFDGRTVPTGDLRASGYTRERDPILLPEFPILIGSALQRY